MHLNLRLSAALALAVLFGLADRAAAAPADEFYRNLLRRGISQVDAGDHQGAARLLRIAAFGLVDSVDEFETAHIYLAVANDGLKRDADARHSAQRVIAAERIQRRYASLSISPAIRSRFEAIAGRVLPPDQTAVLRGGPLPQSVPPSTMVVRRDPSPPPAATNGSGPASKPPVVTTPAPTAPSPPPAAPTAQPVPPPPPPLPAVVPRVVNVDEELDRGDAALSQNNLDVARQIFRALLPRTTLNRDQRVRVGAGLTRARDFAGAVDAFRRMDAFRSGEEPYRYYYAIALFESGDYPGARRELAAALNFIELTPDVQRYRARIESAAN